MSLSDCPPSSSAPLEALEEEELERAFYLPRLGEEAYSGLAAVHWTTTLMTGAGFPLDDAFHARFQALLLHAFVRDAGLMCPAYCLMPDHFHMIWMGTEDSGDQRQTMAFFRTHLKALIAPAQLQHQAHDHVLKQEERKQSSFATACNYVLANPVEAGLAESAEAWPYLGCLVPGYPDLHPLKQVDFWGRFWQIYWKKRGEERKVTEIARALDAKSQLSNPTEKAP